MEPLFGPLPLRDVAREPGEEPPSAYVGFANRELQRKGTAIAPLADNNPSNANDALFTSCPITGEIPIMRLPVR